VQRVAALVACGADHLGGFQLDEGLQYELHRLPHEVHVAAGAQRAEQLGQSRLVEAIVVFLFVNLGRNTSKITRWPLLRVDAPRNRASEFAVEPSNSSNRRRRRSGR